MRPSSLEKVRAALTAASANTPATIAPAGGLKARQRRATPSRPDVAGHLASA